MERIALKKFVPVAVIERVEDAVPLAEALLAGGLDIIEVTLRTDAALPALQKIIRAFPDMLAGAGTILTLEQVNQVVDAGGKFGVAPGLNAKVVFEAKARGLPFVPGVVTASEIERALDLDLKLLKFFPAENMGGVGTLKSLAGPYAHTGVKFIPLGGVTASNAADYLKLPVVAAVGGSWFVDKKLILNQNWAEITSRVEDALELAAGV